jgi:hypothetical protein
MYPALHYCPQTRSFGLDATKIKQIPQTAKRIVFFLYLQSNFGILVFLSFTFLSKFVQCRVRLIGVGWKQYINVHVYTRESHFLPNCLH